MPANPSRTSFRSSCVTIPLLAVLAGVVPPAWGYLQVPDAAATPYSADTWFALGKASLKEKKYQQAEQAFRKLAELEPESSRGVMGVVDVYIAQSRNEEAIQLLQGEVKKNPTRMDYRLALAAVAMRFAKYDLALPQYFEVLRHTDKTSGSAGNIYYLIGEAYRRKGKLDYALIFLRQAKELLPGSLLVLGALAFALDSAGQKEEAAREYQAALDVDPDNASALNNLAFLLSENEANLDVAVKYAERARQLRPDSPAISDTLGWIYLKKNMVEPALGLLRDAVQKEPARSAFHYHLAVALEKKGDHSAATEELKAALKASPSKDEAQKINELAQKIGK